MPWPLRPLAPILIIPYNAHSVYSLRVRGEMYHRLGNLPNDDERARYAQVWMYDGDDLLDAQQISFEGFCRNLLELLNSLLLQNNPYVEAFKMAYQHIAEGPLSNLRLRINDMIGMHDPRRYNRPLFPDQLAAVIPGDEFSER
jgi:hypothetical protein